MTLYVEGGGDRKLLKTECRRAFTSFMVNAGVKEKPRVVACGSRKNAYDSYCTAIHNGEDALLLVDSESLINADHQQGDSAQWKPWAHLKQRPGDRWNMPENGAEEHCHLMVQVMETWFLADRQALAKFFGQGFKPNQLPHQAKPIECIPKTSVYDALAKATKKCKTKEEYGKGAHSFKLLKEIDPHKVIASSPWAKRFIDAVAPPPATSAAPTGKAPAASETDATPLEMTADQRLIIQNVEESRSAKQLQQLTGAKGGIHQFRSRELRPLLDAGLLEMTLPHKPKSSKQQYQLADRGSELKTTLPATRSVDEMNKDTSA